MIIFIKGQCKAHLEPIQRDDIQIKFNSFKHFNQEVSFRVISYLSLVSAVTRGPKYFIDKIRSLSVVSAVRWWPRKESGSLNLVIINVKKNNGGLNA